MAHFIIHLGYYIFTNKLKALPFWPVHQKATESKSLYMKRPLLLFLLIFGSWATVTAQKKSELITENNALRSQLDSVNGLVFEAQKDSRVNIAKAESLESQVNELQDANATLLKNLTSFAEVSSKNSQNINNALESLAEKEAQLKSITDAIASNDSTALVVLTNAKQSLGENAKITVSNGAIVVSESLTTLFNSDTDSNVNANSEPWIGKIAAILKANPAMALTVEGLTMTGDIDLATRQANTVAAVLQKNFQVDPNRLMAIGKDGNFKEGVNFKIHPKFDDFYNMVRKNMKN